MKKSLKISELIKTVIKWIFILIFIMLVLYNIMNINNQEEYVNFIGYKIFVVKDYQAQSTLKKDTVVITKAKNNNPEIGDMVAIRINNGTYFHKIVDIIGNERYITKGDENYQQDGYAYLYEEIEGLIIGRIPWFGKVLNIAETTFFSIMILVILILIFRYNRHIHTKMNRRRLKQKSNNNLV